MCNVEIGENENNKIDKESLEFKELLNVIKNLFSIYKDFRDIFEEFFVIEKSEEKNE